MLFLASCAAKEEAAPVLTSAPPVFEPQKIVVLPAPAAGDSNPRQRSYAEEAKAIANQLQNASALFTVQKELNISEIGSAHLIIDPTHSASTITKDETVDEHVKKQDIKISQTAIAKLTVTPDGLVARETQNALQTINPAGPTEWVWELAPVTEGTYTLDVTLEAVVQVNNSFAPMKQLQFHDKVNIQITKRQVIERWAHNHIDPILNWIWTVLLVPAFLFLTKKFFKKR